MTEHGKLPPQAVDVEKSILGAMMLEKAALIEAMDLITETTFYKEPHQKIFNAINHIYNCNQGVDMITVIEQLTKSGDIDSIGGPFYISELTGAIGHTVNTEEHCFILKEKELKRKQIEISSNVLKQAYDETISPFETNDYLANESINSASIVDFSKNESNHDTIERIKENIIKAATEKGLTGIATGIHRADKIFGGYQNSDLIIKASRPGMGKTAHALCEALYAAVVLGKMVVFFSLEMSKGQLMTRLICVHAGIDSEKLKKGKLSGEDWEKFNIAQKELSIDNLIIVDDIYSINGIVNKCKKIKLEKGIDIIFIDYLQLISGNKKGNREQEISGISRSLKMLAKSTNVPVIALSQLSRNLETRGGDKKPMLSDLRESGAIEQDADIVTFLYRPGYYGITEDAEGNELSYGYTLLLIAKHRNGSLDDIPMEFIPHYTRFENPGGATDWGNEDPFEADIEKNDDFLYGRN